MKLTDMLAAHGRPIPFAAKIADNQSLSFDARGLLLYLLTKGDNLPISLGHLVNASPSSAEETQGIVDELEKAGYITQSPAGIDITDKVVA